MTGHRLVGGLKGYNSKKAVPKKIDFWLQSVKKYKKYLRMTILCFWCFIKILQNKLSFIQSVTLAEDAGDNLCLSFKEATSICQNLVPQISRFDMMELNAECTFLGLSDISYFKISHVIVPLILSHHFCSREHLSSKSSSHPSHQASSSFGIFYTYTPHNIYGKFICCWGEKLTFSSTEKKRKKKKRWRTFVGTYSFEMLLHIYFLE